MSALGAGLGVFDPGEVIVLNALCNRLGLDTISAGGVLGWAVESAERGVLEPAAYAPHPLRWGEVRTFATLLEDIAYRRGLGALLADGVRAAARAVGKGSERWAVEAKGLEQSRVMTQVSKAYALAFAVNPRGPDHLFTQCLAEYGETEEACDLVERITGDRSLANPLRVEKRAEIVRWHEDCYAATDALGFCSFVTTAAYGVTPRRMAALFTAATGIPLTEEELMLAGRRIVNLERCYNVREGFTRRDDILPARMMLDPVTVAGHEYRNTPEELSGMLDEYYRLHGWDVPTGIPTAGTLRLLGLGTVADELDRLGLLPAEGNGPVGR
jgi:aldehyde:ferredoxin oxidoreductase